jgi:hypothetical protein
VTISTVDQLIAGAQRPVSWRKGVFTGEQAGEQFCPIFTAGYPGTATAPTGLNGTALTSSLAGAIPIPASVSGDFIELAGFDAVQGGAVGGVWLMDFLWWNGSIVITTTTNQAITHPGLPARDRSASTNGDGVFLALLVSTTTGNGAPITNTTCSYTSSSGVASHTASITSFPTTGVAGTFEPFNLATGDVGVRTVEGITLGTTYVSGTVHLVQYRPIAYVPLAVAGVGASMAPGVLRRIWDASCLALVYDLTGTAGGVTSGLLQYSQG